MARTMFVNPSLFSNPAKKHKKGRKGSKRKRAGKKGRRRAAKKTTRRCVKYRVVRRNAGITPFIQNPLILSNPRRRRRRRNPSFSMGSLKSVLSECLTDGAGAAAALGVSAFGTNRIASPLYRRGAQVLAAVVGGAAVGSYSKNLGRSFRSAMFFPLVQDLAVDLLGTSIAVSATAKEADVDALAADLEDVLDDMSEGDSYWQDEEDGADMRAW